jgi:hypothetical protein
MDSPPLSPVTRAQEQCLFGSSTWVDSVHVVDFDVDEGHVLEWSSSSDLTHTERYNLCFAAMPDSQPTSGGLGDLCFAFRFPREGPKAPLLWGFSYFRAVRSEACKRGVFQKAVVLLTPLPLFSLFRTAVAVLAEAYFGAGGEADLRDALRELRSWPSAPTAGIHELTLRGKRLSLECVACEPGPAYAIHSVAPEAHAAHAAPSPWALREARDVHALCSLGSSCWTLWQLMLMGESIAILMPSPDRCSAAILALPALISPLGCMSDMRPYLSMLAPDWEQQLSGAPPPPGSGLLVGATNPMLSRALPEWLSLLTLAESASGDAGGGSGPFGFRFGLGRSRSSGGGGSGGSGDGSTELELTWQSQV